MGPGDARGLSQPGLIAKWVQQPEHHWYETQAVQVHAGEEPNLAIEECKIVSVKTFSLYGYTRREDSRFQWPALESET